MAVSLSPSFRNQVLVMDADAIHIIEAAGALVAALIAFWQNRQKRRAEEDTRQVIAFFDPGDGTVTVPPQSVPARSWKMNDATRRWVLSGHDPANRAALLRQIDEAEKKQQVHYFLTFGDRGGGYYEVEYGLVKGSGCGEEEPPH